MTYTVFAGQRRLATGTAADLAAVLRDRLPVEPVLVFSDDTGAQVDLDLRGTPEEIDIRYRTEPEPAPEKRSGPGRPRLGVVSREVSLLPRHWEWLAGQPGGASASLRRLVDAARRDRAGEEQQRLAREAAYRFMVALAGNQPGFEEASRALFAEDYVRLDEIIQQWPTDVRDYTRRLLLPAVRGFEVKVPAAQGAPAPS
jgi:hypothetical protein